MRATSLAQMIVVMGACVFATPAWAQDIDFDADRAVSECVRTLPGCSAAADKAQGMLIFPRVFANTGDVSGPSGDGALHISKKAAGYYRMVGSSVGDLGGGRSVSQIIMFMTPAALKGFQDSSGWEVGANAKVTVIDQGKAADIDTVTATNPVIAYVFGLRGLMGDLSLDGAKITRM